MNAFYLAYSEGNVDQRMYKSCCDLLSVLNESEVEFRAGLNDGVIARGVLSKIKVKTSFVGDAINIAARLCYKADTNSICMSYNPFNHCPIKDAKELNLNVLG